MNHLCFWLGLKDVRESSKFGWTAHYRCISYRPSSVAGKRSGCKAWIKIRHSDGSVDYSPESHSSCLEALKRARVSDIAAPALLLQFSIYPPRCWLLVKLGQLEILQFLLKSLPMLTLASARLCLL